MVINKIGIKNGGIILFLIIYNTIGMGQIDTSITIEEVEVNAIKIRETSVGGESQTWDTKTLNQLPPLHLADFLSTEMGIFIKSYGLGSLATSSMRGAGAGHTLVLWNGLPIQSPMLGLLDLSLLPMQAAEQVQVKRGGTSAMWGSGAVGGLIALNNKATYDKKLQISTQSTIGSFGHYRQQAQVKIGNQRLQSHTKLSYQHADNDFFYAPHPDLPKRQQANAAILQRHFWQDLYYEVTPYQKIATHFWYQYAHRQIPPTIVQTASQAYQNDDAIRLVLDWHSVHQKMVWSGKIGYFKEHLDYFDRQISLTSLSEFSTWQGELEAQWAMDDRQKLYIGSTQSNTTATADGYTDDNSEYKGAVFVNYQFHDKNWETQLSLRQGWVDGRFIPLVPILGVHKSMGKRFELKFKISKNYRLPTLNDRFWQPGGNADLLPESGWSQETSLVFKHQTPTIKARLAVTGFNRTMENWILWSISEGQSFWSANNISKVWSRGLESHLRLTYQPNTLNNTLKYEWMGGYHYIRSTNEITLLNPNIPAGQQLFYTPVHQFFSTFKVRWRQLLTTYQHQFTSTTLGVNENLSAYHLGNFKLRYQFKYNQLTSTIFFNVQNIWNTSYFVVERRPMAGRSMQLGVRFYFDHAFKTVENR